MVKSTLHFKDRKFRLNYYRNERKYKILKALQYNQFLPILLRMHLNLKLIKYTEGSRSRMVNRCIVTNRGQAVYRPFNLSRHQIKRFLIRNQLPGIKKAS